MIRVFIADDHEVVRDGLWRALDDRPGVSPCGVAASIDELFERMRAAAPDVVVLDVHMPGSDGPDVVRDIRRAPGAPAVVVFTRFDEDSHAIAYLRAGASAFLSKRRSMNELNDAIAKAAGGGRYITPTLADYLFVNQVDIERAPGDVLSEREIEVVRFLSEGLRATEIAASLGLSASTVNTYVQRIRVKLGVRTTVEIVRFAEENGLL
ncbi:MAG: response regulator transcription factor [Deltaproteobacteria bacterium]|nr:MAG: response regulator transcription factor [Deltaproteobacteria bacterium]